MGATAFQPGQMIARAPIVCGGVHTLKPDQRLGAEMVSGSAAPLCCGLGRSSQTAVV